MFSADQAKRRKKSLITLSILLILVLGISVSYAANPLITSIYTADPDCLVANNAFYIYCGRDEAAPGQQAFVMREWHILKSTDMQHWTDLGAKLSLSNFSWANANAWAGSVCYKNGKYWWYVPVNDRATNAMAIGVASSTSPEGPFTDALGRALITNRTPNCNIFNIDPGVFVDDDGQAYLYWGGYWALRAVKLNDDMISFSGTPIQPSGVPYSGPNRYWEAPTLRKYNGLYYLSYAANQNPATIEYCTATNPMGPWTYRGRILDTTSPTGTNHHSYAQFAGRWFIAYHTNPAGDDYHRRVCVDEMFYNPDGTIRKVIQTSTGPSPVTIVNPTPTLSSSPTPTPTQTPQTNPVTWYRFDETGGTTAADSSGNRHATLVGGATWVAGRINNAVNLSGSSQYVSMPSGIVSNLNDFTIATWVKLDTVGTWSRIFDFGTGTSVNMFLTPQSGSTIRYAITTSGSGGEQRINGTAALPAGVWKHVAVTLSGNTGILYMDGVEVGRNNNMTLRPSSLGSTGNNYIGRSQYAADPYLDGQIDDFRIYNRGLSASEIQGLFNASSPAPTPTITATVTPAITPTPTPGGNQIAWYRFDETGGNTAYDSSGNGRNATLNGGPTWVAGRTGNAVNLSGSNQYVSMPWGIVSSLNDFTITAWVRLDTISTWSRIFDFGTGTSVNMFLTPRGGSNVIRFAITTGGSGAEQRINGTAALPVGTWKHVAVTLSGNTGILYVDGVEAGRNNNMTLRPSSLGNTGNNYIGRSQYAADPYLDGQIDNFRIYNRALSASEISNLYWSGS